MTVCASIDRKAAAIIRSQRPRFTSTHFGSLLACLKQSAGRNRVWPLVFSVELAIVEAERAEEEAERLIHSLTISPEPARQDASEREAMASRHILPRITASATKSLREALEGFDRATEISRELEAFIRGRKIH